MEGSELKIEQLNKDCIPALQSILPFYIVEFIKTEEMLVFAALEENEVAAVVTVLIDEETLSLNVMDIYTVEKNRRQGIAEWLLSEVLYRINESMDYMLRYVLADFSESNQAAYGFFDTLGFDIQKETGSNKYIYTLKSVKESFLMQKKYTISADYDKIKYSDLGEVNRRKLISAIEAKGGSYDRAFAADIDKELSVSVWKNNQLVGIVEIILEANGEVCLGQFFSLKIDTVMLAVLQNVAETLFERFSDDTKFTIYVIGESSARLIEKLLGEPEETASLMLAEYSLETFDDTLADLIEEVPDGEDYEQAE